MMARSSVPPASSRCGAEFPDQAFDSEYVRPADCDEPLSEVVVVCRKPLNLVRAHCRLIATFRKRIERIGHSWQRVIVFREVRAAIRDENRKQFFELWRRTKAPFGFKQSWPSHRRRSDFALPRRPEATIPPASE